MVDDIHLLRSRRGKTRDGVPPSTGTPPDLWYSETTPTTVSLPRPQFHRRCVGPYHLTGSRLDVSNCVVDPW